MLEIAKDRTIAESGADEFPKKRPGKMVMPAHGGDLSWASDIFGIAQDAWFDLSTGVSPWSWCTSDIPAHVWRTLPPNDRHLLAAAADYYGCAFDDILATPGSQFAIAHIPQLMPVCDVAIPALGYAEHQLAWRRAGHRIHYYSNRRELTQLVDSKRVRSVVVINPNNPSSELFCVDFLQHIQHHLEALWGDYGLLLIDEAFIDLTPQHSIINADMPANTIVLRSVGKYFGLAGIRLGFAISGSKNKDNKKTEISTEKNIPWLTRLAQHKGVWSINHPALFIGQQALADKAWIASQKQRIEQQSQQMYHILSTTFQRQIYNAGLFLTMWGSQEQCLDIFAHFAHRGVLLRYGEQCHGHNDSQHNPIHADQKPQAWLRFGLPGEHIDIFKRVIQEYI